MIDIICYYDDHHNVLFDNFFFPSYQKHLSSSFNLIPYKTTSKHKETSFESQNWCEIMIDRFDILKEYIRNNPSKWAIFSDIDIVFFDNFIIDVISYLHQDNIDIAYMSEYLSNNDKWHINGGFFLFKCSDYIYNYFDDIQNNVKKMSKPNDQKFIHGYLKNNPSFRNTILDKNVFLANNQNMNDVILLIKKKMIKVFHATSTLSLLSKIQVLSTALCIDATNTQLSNEKGSRLWI